MLGSIDDYDVQCPYCWQRICIRVEASDRIQTFVEDCTVCCRPMVIRCGPNKDGRIAIEVERES